MLLSQRRSLVTLAMLVAMAAASLACYAAEGPGAATPYAEDIFPKIANISISANANYRDAASHAKYDINIIGMWKGWGGGTAQMRAVLQKIKELNPNIKLAKYTHAIAANSTGADAATIELYKKLNSERGPGGIGDWWARDSQGNLVKHSDTVGATNITEYVTPDANGDRYSEWLAKWDNENFFAPIPEFDIWYIDNFNYRPRIDPDWDRDGRNDSRDDPLVRKQFREGIMRYVNKAKELQPNLVIMGNVDGPGHIDSTTGDLQDPEYKHQLGGALLENAIGKSYSRETWGSWEAAMTGYRRLMANTLPPHYVIFSNTAKPDDYKTVRYIIASALMDDGYVAICDGGYNSRLWFDEYDLAGKATSKWLGRAVDEPQLSPWQNGVYVL